MQFIIFFYFVILMIKKLVLLIIILCVIFVLRKINLEQFHELEEEEEQEEEAESEDSEQGTNRQQCQDGSTQRDQDGCGVKYDFNPRPQEKDYILASCILHHTGANDNFKDNGAEGCPRHQILCESSGCKDAVNFYWRNIELLNSITQDTSSSANSYNGALSDCVCNHDADDTSDTKDLYERWIETIS
jgi:hypothetical protein